MPARLRHLSFVLCASALLLYSPGRAQQLATTNAPSSALTSPADAAKKMIADAIKQMDANDVDGALNSLTKALTLNPNITLAYVLRASAYCQKKQWALAEADFRTAARIDPTNVVLKFQLIDVKFMQKQYDAARPGFVALESDPDMGDFAAYKVFLCDLFGGHEDVAKQELDAFTDAMDNPSCEFSNAAWQLVHKNLDGDNGARYWLLRASRIYPPRKNAYYAQSLRDLGYLPIPAPGDKVTPPPAAGTPSHP
jgi:tetratricopeptide (TPR) repeat protein